jgi:hypothetical protein
MGLGIIEDGIPKQELIDAMKKLPDTNVDEAVEKNLGALGEAIYRIATVHAQTISDQSIDNNFWKWVADVNVWLGELEKWQTAIVKAFEDWIPTNPADLDLQTAVKAVSSPGSLPAAPTQLKGKIE